MNALLVYPQYPNTFWSFKHVLKFIAKKAIFPPLGLLTIASMLPKDWSKKLIDTNVKELTNDDIKWADLVLISAMLVQDKSAREIINRVKKFNKTIAAGGPAFTTGYKHFQGVDHFILNEAEITLPLFLKDLTKGKAKHIYSSTIRPDISQTPPPLWSLINLKDYQSMAIQYSRGCPFNCEFCDIVIMNGRIPRLKTINQLMNEFEVLFKTGWKGDVFIVDDNFIGNKKTVKIMLPSLIKWQKRHHYPFKLLTEASVNLAEETELLSKMSRANFYKVFIGIETTNTDSLVECGKFQNIKKDPVEVIKIVQQYGMQVMAGFIVGFDNDSPDIFERQIKFIEQTGVVTAMVGLLSALPKTRLWSRLKKEGRLLNKVSGENTDGSLNFKPMMKAKKLITGYKKIINTIYKPKHYYQRIDKFIKSYHQTVKSRIYKDDFMAFFRSIWKIGIVSEARFYYWLLLIKTLLTKKKALPIAVELAILGEHFRITAKKISGK